MIFLKRKIDCVGCNACVQRCPMQCITMQEDSEGFLYPSINQSLCIDCGICERTCPVINLNKERIPLQIYATKNTNEKTRYKSSSGGIFTLLAEKTIYEEGVVFGARFDENWEVKHDYTETIDGLAAFRGSKYLQSRIENTYQEVKYFLKQKRKVLYTGTPCQIAGLKRYLNKEYDNLLTVDFVCHGVPSPKVWRLYLDEITGYKNIKTKKPTLTHLPTVRKKIIEIKFRDKIKGWKKFSLTLTISDEIKKNKIISISETLEKNIFLRGFLNNLFLRPSCYACPCKCLKSGSDITIGDYWGIENVLPEFRDDKGCSLAMINTQKGDLYYKSISSFSINTSYQTACFSNPSIETSVYCPSNRELFFETLNHRSITTSICKYTRIKIIRKIKNKILSLLNKIRLIHERYT